ncbi:MAG: Surface antigen [Chthoniobacteraceae bacterium]|nr:Surface antigen [Chthoniobacteraceae bacterium]
MRASSPLNFTWRILAVLSLVTPPDTVIGAPVAQKTNRLLEKVHALKPSTPADSGNIQFSGARSYTPEQLRVPLAEQIREINERGLTKPRADDTAYYLAIYYRKQGFPDVEVTFEIHGRTLLLRVAEGPRTYLRTITFHGNRSIPESTLYEYMLGATRERLQMETTSFPFVLADVQTGVARVRGLYESQGYLNAVVEDPKVAISADRSRADITVNIAEGQAYSFGEFIFVGETLFKKPELIAGLGLPAKAPYTPQQVNTAQRNLQFFYKSHGYYQAQVEAASDPTKAANGRVSVTFTVKPGPLFRFDGVKVTRSGDLDFTPRLNPDFLPRRFAPLTGQVYDPAKLDEKYRELLRTGLFKNLRLNSVPLPDQTIRIDLTAEEAKAKEVGFSLGASSYEGIEVGLRLGDRDIFGSGRPLTFSVDMSQRALRGELLYVDPWLFESKFSLRARLYEQSREEKGYSKLDTGIRTDLGRKLTKTTEIGLFVLLKNVEITETTIDLEFLGPTSYQLASLGFTHTSDFRDNAINPSHGFLVSDTIDINAVAGEVAFARATVRLSYYHPIGKKLALALGARGGFISPFTDVPIDERFFSGGATTVRSFTERSLGPKDNHRNPIGGELFTVFNAEVTFPIVKALQGAVFVDAGNVIGKSADAGLQEMRYAIGLGLRYKLPIGPLRLDYGVNPNPKNGESFGAFHFTFGFAF